MIEKYINNFVRRLIVVLLVFISFYFYSCGASSHESGNANKIRIDWTIEEIKQKINQNSLKLKSFDAEGDISIDTPDMNNSGSLIVSINKPDSIYIKIEGPFGISVANMLITRTNFIYYNAMDNVVYKGTSSSVNLGAILNFKINFDDLVNSFSGSLIFEDTSSDNTTIDTDNNGIILTISDNINSTIKKYWVDSKNFYVYKYGIYNKNNEILFEAEYTNYEYLSGTYFPGKISISKPKDKQYVWLNYTDKTLYTNHLNYKLKIPKSAKEIIWD
jgi:hypothetical protein